MVGREESAQPGRVGESQLRLEVGIFFGPKGKEREKDIPGRGNKVWKTTRRFLKSVRVAQIRFPKLARMENISSWMHA